MSDECECGDYRDQHVLERGPCRVCRDGVPPPDGADGCQRFRPSGVAQSDHDFRSTGPSAGPKIWTCRIHDDCYMEEHEYRARLARGHRP